ncbi:hypothetical protein ARMGADRAFT_1029702 [Armillaria gallica]|uniref:Uncharacterized protein n=1 Tax=Armillaria gallica TaxID=47427 RepID=A0A2H3DF22_ARMGA|nr:hypothetical protein ARMGADRAFT_1029702 [Armillaria gallica]
MAKIYIAVHESELVVWTADVLADVLARLTALSHQLHRALDGRNGHLSVRYLQATDEHPHKTLKLYDADCVLLGSVHFGRTQSPDSWIPREPIDIALDRCRTVLGRILSPRIFYNHSDHVYFGDELELFRETA